MNESMNLDKTMQQVRACATRMDAEYGSTVFDEWVVVSLRQPQARVLAYTGPVRLVTNELQQVYMPQTKWTASAGQYLPLSGAGSGDAAHACGTGGRLSKPHYQ